MSVPRAVWLILGGVGAWYFLTQTSTGESAVETVTAAVAGWQNVNEGPTWVPVINQTEVAQAIPTNLLARQAYQESRFRQDVIDGTTTSSAGALGILQLEPAFFSTVGSSVAIPYTAGNTTDQISQAGQEMASLYKQFGDWGLALAAYDWGSGNVSTWLAAGGTGAMPTETQNYVSQILTDVPVPSVLMPAQA
jgi:soluble lytic murein transglycosylase-like protein